MCDLIYQARINVDAVPFSFFIIPDLYTKNFKNQKGFRENSLNP